MQIYKLNKEDIPGVWLTIRPFLDAALNKYDVSKKFPLDCVLRDLVSGASQGWVIVNDAGVVVSAIVTEIEHYPLCDTVIIFLMGGESMEDWGDLLHNAIVKYAQEVGAKWIETGSRRGIGKLFYDRLGYKRRYESYSYEVKCE